MTADLRTQLQHLKKTKTPCEVYYGATAYVRGVITSITKDRLYLDEGKAMVPLAAIDRVRSLAKP